MGFKREPRAYFRSKLNKSYDEKAVIESLRRRYEEIDVNAVKQFDDLPLSPSTLKGLRDSGFEEPTEIQRESIGLALRGLDILGAAKTGSGKTLAFLIPALEILFRNQWTYLDKLGILIITPTRELAFQIFATIRKVGRHHDFSCGLIIGGKDLKFETQRMDQCNIVIGTPGRILQHMNENPLFDCTNLQMLVLDEADRCLDMGFEAPMNGIIENLPPQRQTLLFSATQTKSVRSLARLSLKDPMYVSVHEHALHSTPEALQQSYMVCELHQKMDLLWSFLRNHRRSKILVFLSSCKQVKYTFEMFCRLRPGISVMALYGTLHQLRRMTIYEEFCKKQRAVLFATDIASRGLDFPDINWVIQLDCPENAQTYIHRVGRTARYKENGESLLVLLPSEEQAILEELNKHKIPINKIKVNPRKLQSPLRKMEAFLARDPNLKESAQRAFKLYLKSVYLMKNKKVFNIHALDTDSYARSLGLAIPPRIRFLKKVQEKMEEKSEEQTSVDEEEDVAKLDINSSDDNTETGQELTTKSSSYVQEKTVYNFGSVESDSEDDLLKVKRRNHNIEVDVDVDDQGPPVLSGSNLMSLEDEGSKKTKKVVTKAAMAKRFLKRSLKTNKKVTFNEEGETQYLQGRDKMSEKARAYEAENEGGIDIEKARLALREEDRYDKKLYMERCKAKRREKKLKEKDARRKYEKEEKGLEAGDGDDVESDEGPDLDWLPDPDKVYGNDDDDTEGNPSSKNKRNVYEEDDDEQSDDGPNLDWLPDPDEVYGNDDDGEGKHTSKNKRKVCEDDDQQSSHHKKLKLAPNKKHKKKNTSQLDSTLEADEQLALQLLSRR